MPRKGDVGERSKVMLIVRGDGGVERLGRSGVFSNSASNLTRTNIATSQVQFQLVPLSVFIHACSKDTTRTPRYHSKTARATDDARSPTALPVLTSFPACCMPSNCRIACIYFARVLSKFYLVCYNLSFCCVIFLIGYPALSPLFILQHCQWAQCSGGP